MKVVSDFVRRRRSFFPSLAVVGAIGVIGAAGCSGTVDGGPPPPGGGGNGPGVMVDPNTPITGMPAPSSRLVRLNSKQWENSVQDLLKLTMPLGFSSGFVKESLATSFDTNGSLLEIDTNQWSGFKRAALKVANMVARDPKLLAQVAPPSADPATRAKNFIRDFGGKTFRRPLSDAEMAPYLDLFNKGAMLLVSGDGFADGVEMVLRAFFQSPNFLYRIETSDAVVNGKIPLNNYEVAARLSYSLTNSTPDDTLLSAAAAKMLTSRDSVGAQAKRLLESPAGQATVADFHYQLLHLENDDQIAKDPAKAPAYFTPDLNPALKSETLAFVHDIVFGQNKGVAEMLTAPYTFANSQVAKVYGVNVPAPAAGDPFVRIPLDPTQRAGVLTQAGFLTFFGGSPTTNIIMRGARIGQDVLCVDIPEPPPNIPPLRDLQATETNRKRVEEQTRDMPCSNCHPALINPLGFALENLDGLAQFRTMENGQPIDATGNYNIDGKDVSFDGAVALMKLIGPSQQAHDCYARRVAEYMYGRGVTPANASDKDLIAQAGAHAKADPSAKNLILKLVTADEFLNRAP